MDLSVFHGLIRVIVVLALLIPMVYGVTRLYGRQRMRAGSIAVRELMPLGHSRSLCVIEWEGHRYLLGMTAQNITLIERIPSCAAVGEEEEDS